MKRQALLTLLVFLCLGITAVCAESAGPDAEAVCETREEVRLAVNRFMAGGISSFRLVCPRRLGAELTEDGSLFAYMAFNGAENCSLLYIDSDPWTFLVEDIQPFTVPFRAVSDENQFLNAVDDMSRQQAASFVICFERDFFNELQADPDKMDMLWYSSQADSGCSCAVNSGSCIWMVDKAVYSDEPKFPCYTEEDIDSAVRQMGASGTAEFQLVISSELYQAIRADGFARLEQLAAGAGMSSCDMSYSAGERMGIVFCKNAVIRADVKKLNTPFEAAEWVRECVNRGEKEIPLFCTPELFTQLLENGVTSRKGNKLLLINDVISNAGISRYSIRQSSVSGLISLAVESLYPGTEILLAERSGNLSSLTDREIRTLDRAKELVAECVGKTDKDNDGWELDLAEMLHDLLCDMIDYTDDKNSEEDDSAIGAVLSGTANCDGYADAFYLLGNLAGLDVRYQYGDGYTDDGPDLGDLVENVLDELLDNEEEEESLHMWNLLKIDDTWRVVDLTWDDQENGIRHTWFNIGEDRASRIYIRNLETSVPLAGQTVLSERPANEYLIGSGLTEEAALQDVIDHGYSEFEWVYASAEAEDHEAACELISGRAAGSFSWSWEERMLTLHVSGYR